MRYSFALLILCSYLLPTYSSAESAAIQSLVSQGTGTSYESAAQNATENALTQAVGSFIDTETNIEKKKVIADGVRSKSKSITKETKEYSQGSIAYFEVLSAEETGGLWRVEARVDVRIEDFKAYIKELASAEQDVGVGLFAQMSVDTEQTEDKVKLLIDNVTGPIMSGEVYNVEIGAPTPLKVYLKNNPSNSTLKKWAGHPNVVVFPVKISLKPEFLENALNVLDNLAEKKKRWAGQFKLYTSGAQRPFEYGSWNPEEDFDLTFSKTPTNHITYLITGVGTPLRAKYQQSLNLRRGPHPFFGTGGWEKLPYALLQVSLIDKDGLALREDIFDYHDAQQSSCYSAGSYLCSGSKSFFLPVEDEMFASQTNNIGHLLELKDFKDWYIRVHKSFLLVMQLTPDELKNTRKVKLEYFKD